MTNGGMGNRDYLLKRYEEQIDMLYKAEKWALDNGLEWEDVKVHNCNYWEKRNIIINNIKILRKNLGLQE